MVVNLGTSPVLSENESGAREFDCACACIEFEIMHNKDSLDDVALVSSVGARLAGHTMDA